MLFLEKTSVDDMKKQWDSIAKIRFEQQRSGKDISYIKYLKPTILELLNSEYSGVLDLGCGNGDLTKDISFFSESIIGLDFSKKNIELAKKYNSNGNITYICKDAGNYLKSHHRFDAIIANMFLQDYPDLSDIIKKVYRSLQVGGIFVFSITHPLYWPKYWKYNNEPWFDYNKEIIIEYPFKISSENISDKKTIHFHRPLYMYENILYEVGFKIEIKEEISTKDTSSFKHPKFLVMKCIK